MEKLSPRLAQGHHGSKWQRSGLKNTLPRALTCAWEQSGDPNQGFPEIRPRGSQIITCQGSEVLTGAARALRGSHGHS